MDQSLTEILPRMLGSMAVVILVMWVAARFLRNRQLPSTKGGSTKRNALVQVLSRQSLGRHTNITVVRTGDKVLVLGITENNLTVLTELDQVDIDQQPDAHRTDVLGNGNSPEFNQAWTGLLTQIRERTVRRT